MHPIYQNVTPVCISQLVSLPEAKLLLKEDDELIKEVFDYWSRKRKNSKANSLIPTVKQEKRDGSSTSDPYVAFRRRTEKMQTRKVSRQFVLLPSPCWLLDNCGWGLRSSVFLCLVAGSVCHVRLASSLHEIVFTLSLHFTVFEKLGQISLILFTIL